jgi:predicted site-specific integrase-resolvase
VRFGFGWLQEAFSGQGVRLEVDELPKQREPTEAFGQHLLTIVTVFAGRHDAHRAKEVSERVKTALKVCEEKAYGTGQQNDHTPA